MSRGHSKVEPLNKSGAKKNKQWPQLKEVSSWATTQLGCSKSDPTAFFPCLQLLPIVTHHSIAWRNFSDWIFSQQKTTDWKKKGQTCDKFWSLYPELNVWGLESADSDITPHFGWKTKWTPEFFLFLSFSEAVILPWFSNRIGRTKMLKHLNQLSSGYYLQLNKTKSQKSLRPLKPWSSQFTRAHHTHTGQIIWR